MKKRKYTKTKNVDGFRSGLETSVWKKVPKRVKPFVKYEPEKLQYLLPKTYNPDFVIERNGSKIYVEVKGYLRYEDQVKMRAVKASNPFLDIRFVFAQDNKVAGSKMVCSEWCTKYGFQYAFGSIPKEWFK